MKATTPAWASCSASACAMYPSASQQPHSRPPTTRSRGRAGSAVVPSVVSSAGVRSSGSSATAAIEKRAAAAAGAQSPPSMITLTAG
eukprot:4616771-Prymnesium_polylepis.1